MQVSKANAIHCEVARAPNWTRMVSPLSGAQVSYNKVSTLPDAPGSH
ncbi:hypothetical protein [Paenibacillus lautus]|nr:hypothetical protein [Paenibacillus lautus]MBU5344342.1 hypothetical protein [Paenibacillus lautus]